MVFSTIVLLLFLWAVQIPMIYPTHLPQKNPKQTQQTNRNKEAETNSEFALLVFMSASITAAFVLNE